MIFQEGKMPLSSLNNNIKYSFKEFKTPSGICSIKFWIFLKQNTNNTNNINKRIIRFKKNKKK